MFETTVGLLLAIYIVVAVIVFISTFPILLHLIQCDFSAEEEGFFGCMLGAVVISVLWPLALVVATLIGPSYLIYRKIDSIKN